jgi:hypothetical protein
MAEISKKRDHAGGWIMEAKPPGEIPEGRHGGGEMTDKQSWISCHGDTITEELSWRRGPRVLSGAGAAQLKQLPQ